MGLTLRQLNRATLARQLLLRREPLTVVDAVRRVMALQAQQAASPYVALWNRVASFNPADLDAAFVDRTVVKASLMRITLHAVAAEDYPTFHDAMLSSLRAARLYDNRFKAMGLTIAEADALVPGLVELASEPRTKAGGTSRHPSQAGAVVGAAVVRSVAPRADGRAMVLRDARVVRRRGQA
jgi:hypothetical protein